MDSTLHWKLPDDYDATRICAFLERRHIYRVDPPMREARSYLDTFDGLLYAESLAVYHSESELVVEALNNDDSEPVRVQAASKPTTVSESDNGPAYAPGGAVTLPSGPVRDRIASIIGPRALLPLATVDVSRTVYRILNRDRKTVARLVYTLACPCTNDPGVDAAAWLSLAPVRGYAKAARALARDLGPGEPIASVEAEIFAYALTAAGQTPGGYSAKLDLQLDPEMRADEAAKAILRQLLEILRTNEAGIRDDIDIEFLHDYRVAVRKTRAALSQIRDVFPADVTERYKRAFRALGQSTNALRDLDVYLQAEPEYRAMLPAGLREDIEPLFDHLRGQRSEALADTVESIDASETQRMLSEWADFLLAAPLDPSEESSAANAGVPILDYSRRRIYRSYRRIVKRGKPLAEHAEDEELHALRIEAKKLRYLLEFFASLYPPKKHARLVRELKKLQDNLGEFNDLSMQQAHLLDVAGELPLDGARTAKALVATGALVEILARRQDGVRVEFADRFGAFASDKNRKLYRDLFGDR